MLKRGRGFGVRIAPDRVTVAGEGHEEKTGIFSENFPNSGN